MERRKTKQRQIIWSIIKEAARPLSPTEIYELGKKRHSLLSLATVYRGLKSLLGDKHIVAVNLLGQPDRYESRDCASHHHHHFQCEDCDRVFDVSGCTSAIDRNAPAGFKVHSHQVVLYGLCKDCADHHHA